MSDGKKDLTRIEDLGEFLHELDDTENYLEPPALPDEDVAALEDELPSLPDDAPAEDDFAPPSLPGEGEDEVLEFGVEADVEFASSPGEEITPFELGQDEAVIPLTETVTGPTEEALDFNAPGEDALFEHSSHESAAVEASEAAAHDMEAEESAPSSSDSWDEPLTSSSPLRPAETMEAFTPKEDFQETRSFAEKAVLSEGPAECNPAFSVIARNIRFLEDSAEILTLLKEAGFPEDMMTQFQRQLERGSLLIPRVSEFTAVFLSHRLRRFRLELSMGPSDLLHPSRGGREEQKGLVSRRTLGQNQHHQFQFKNDGQESRHIILSTMPHLDGHDIERYLGVASEHTFLPSEEVENETAEAIHKSYDELAQKLKGHALHHRANAVVGINYQLTPMPGENPGLGTYRYKLTCTGNLVWVHKH